MVGVEIDMIVPGYEVSNAVFADGFGYQWMLHKVHKEVSFKERIRLWERKKSELL